MTVGPTTPTPLGLRVLVELYALGPSFPERLAASLWTARRRGWRPERRARNVQRALLVLQLGGLAEYVHDSWRATDTGAHVARREQDRARRRIERAARRSS